MHRREHEPHRTGVAGSSEPREPEPLPAEAAVLGLQRAAGNHAVSALLARQPTQADSPEALPTAERGATMTLGLGDEIGVIPLESASWGDSRRGEVHQLNVSFVNNPALPKIEQAALRGTPIPSGFYSTSALTFTLTDVVLANISMTESHDEAAMYINLSLDFRKVEQKPVR